MEQATGQRLCVAVREAKRFAYALRLVEDFTPHARRPLARIAPWAHARAVGCGDCGERALAARRRRPRFVNF
jgi:hypothetical protein